MQHNELPEDQDHIFVRQRNTFYFTKIAKQFHSLKELYNAIDEAFKGALPIDQESPDYARPYYGNKRIYSVYKSYISQHDALRNSSFTIDNDEKARNLKPNDKLDVIYIH